jgi:hypothetical protein
MVGIGHSNPEATGFDAVDGDPGGWDAAQFGSGHGHAGGGGCARGQFLEQPPLLADVAVERIIRQAQPGGATASSG